MSKLRGDNIQLGGPETLKQNKGELSQKKA